MKNIWLISFVTILLAGCGNSVPGCGDQQTTDLVEKIAGQEMEKQIGLQAAQVFSYDVSAIRTTNTNEKTGAHECAAQLVIKSATSAQSQELAITYTVEKTDDGKHIYVNVLGL